jgi:hypothetical protein
VAHSNTFSGDIVPRREFIETGPDDIALHLNPPVHAACCVPMRKRPFNVYRTAVFTPLLFGYIRSLDQLLAEMYWLDSGAQR